MIECYGDIEVEKWKHHNEIVTYLKPLKVSTYFEKDTEKWFYEWKDQSCQVLEPDSVVGDRFK